MPNILKFAEEAQSQIDKQLKEIEGKNKALSMRTGRVKKRETAANERDKQLGEWEKALEKKYEEVQRLDAAKLAELRSQENDLKADNKLEEARELTKKNDEKLAQIKQREAEVLAREKEATKREKGMRKKLQAEFAESLVKGLTGKK
jgi:hypothetical protein